MAEQNKTKQKYQQVTPYFLSVFPFMPQPNDKRLSEQLPWVHTPSPS